MQTNDIDVRTGTAQVTDITARVAAAADQMYRAECALHAARQAHIDAWVAAAYDRLHEAILEHSAALAVAA